MITPEQFAHAKKRMKTVKMDMGAGVIACTVLKDIKGNHIRISTCDCRIVAEMAPDEETFQKWPYETMVFDSDDKPLHHKPHKTEDGAITYHHLMMYSVQRRTGWRGDGLDPAGMPTAIKTWRS